MNKIAQWIAYHLPRRIVYWCAIRATVHATIAKSEWQRDDVTKITIPTVLSRWDEPATKEKA